MTPDTNQKLCRDIAEAEGHKVSSNGRYIEGRLDEDSDIWYVSLYLTDPAETVRMEIAVLKFGYRPYWSNKWQKFRFIEVNPIRRICQDPVYEIAVAQAYLAMLQARKEAA